jgi:hypothetical protein
MRYCPRKLKRGEVKRYMTRGPLFGYMIGCPSCGFIELHQHDKAGFVDEPTGDEASPFRLLSAAHPVRCMFCTRTISIAGGIIMAVKHVESPVTTV